MLYICQLLHACTCRLNTITFITCFFAANKNRGSTNFTMLDAFCDFNLKLVTCKAYK